MRKKYNFLFILTLLILFLFYRVDSIVAMANVQFKTFDAKEREQDDESIDDSEQSNQPADDPEQDDEPVDDPDPEQDDEPVDDPDPKQEDEPVDDPDPEQEDEPVNDLDLKQDDELIDNPDPEQSGDVVDEIKSEQMIQTDAVPVTKQKRKSAVNADAEQHISTGPALLEWLEAHKNTGGTARLTDNIVVDEDYSYCPNGTDRPSVAVNTDQYTITVTGEVELCSDGQLVFSGQPDGKSIFYVASKGMLSMLGVIVESGNGQCTLWQEEGAGLIIEDCDISGDIHYADMPFVIYQNPVSVVVEEGQTLNDVLSAQVSCTVNRQGKTSHNEQVLLSWDLEGTENLQEERQRFNLQGTFLDMMSAEPASCLVIYNDYPLTFTEVKATVSGSYYMFQGWYTKPEEDLPITVMAEYSFDGQNWTIAEETDDFHRGFFICIKSEPYEIEEHPNIYIRLQCNDNGSRHFSNVLCYAADNLENVEDIGGSRGGGTSIINPPENPQQSIVDDSSDEKQLKAADSSNDSGNVGSQTGSDTPSDNTTVADYGGADMIQGEADGGQSSMEEDSGADREQPLYGEQSHADTEQPPYEEQNHAGTEQPLYGEQNHADTEQPPYEEQPNTGTKQSLYAGAKAVGGEESSSVSFSRANEQAVYSDTYKGSYIVIAIGFVLLSAVSGIVGFYVHSHSGTNR